MYFTSINASIQDKDRLVGYVIEIKQIHNVLVLFYELYCRLIEEGIVHGERSQNEDLNIVPSHRSPRGGKGDRFRARRGRNTG